MSLNFLLRIFRRNFSAPGSPDCATDTVHRRSNYKEDNFEKATIAGLGRQDSLNEPANTFSRPISRRRLGQQLETEAAATGRRFRASGSNRKTLVSGGSSVDDAAARRANELISLERLAHKQRKRASASRSIIYLSSPKKIASLMTTMVRLDFAARPKPLGSSRLMPVSLTWATDSTRAKLLINIFSQLDASGSHQRGRVSEFSSRMTILRADNCLARKTCRQQGAEAIKRQWFGANYRHIQMPARRFNALTI